MYSSCNIDTHTHTYTYINTLHIIILASDVQYYCYINYHDIIVNTLYQCIATCIHMYIAFNDVTLMYT